MPSYRYAVRRVVLDTDQLIALSRKTSLVDDTDPIRRISLDNSSFGTSSSSSSIVGSLPASNVISSVDTSSCGGNPAKNLKSVRYAVLQVDDDRLLEEIEDNEDGMTTAGRSGTTAVVSANIKRRSSTTTTKFPEWHCRCDVSSEIVIRQEWHDVANLGASVWRGAVLLCNYLGYICPELVRGRRVLEISSGTGLVSVMMARIGAKSVTATELGCMTALLTHNIRRNKVSDIVGVVEHEWGRFPVNFPLERGEFDLVVASEVVYEPTVIQPLLHTLLYLCGDRVGYRVIISNDLRPGTTARDFFALAKSYFTIDQVDEDVLLEFAPDWVPSRGPEEGVFLLRRNDFTDYRTATFCRRDR